MGKVLKLWNDLKGVYATTGLYTQSSGGSQDIPGKPRSGSGSGMAEPYSPPPSYPPNTSPAPGTNAEYSIAIPVMRI
jgi:hypothetical protein